MITYIYILVERSNREIPVLFVCTNVLDHVSDIVGVACIELPEYGVVNHPLAQVEVALKCSDIRRYFAIPIIMGDKSLFCITSDFFFLKLGPILNVRSSSLALTSLHALIPIYLFGGIDGTDFV